MVVGYFCCFVNDEGATESSMARTPLALRVALPNFPAGAPVRNLDSAVRQAHLDVNAVVASPIAAGRACLSEEERDLGVALVELGAAVTTVSLYAGGRAHV